MPKKRNSDIAHNKRRAFIFARLVLDNTGALSISEIKQDFPDYDEEKAKADVEAFKKVGCAIAIQSSSEKRGKVLVFLDGLHTNDDTNREETNGAEKEFVAQFIAALICGPGRVRGKDLVSYDFEKVLKESNLDAVSCRETGQSVKLLLRELQEKGEVSGVLGQNTCDSIVKLLSRSQERKKELRGKLHDYWEESNRMVAIDSGTTNLKVAKLLAKLRIPLANSRLCSLTVCTNSRRIFEVLGPHKIPVKTIIIGGQQKFKSATIAGAMAELFLRTASILQFGMCILGATKVDVEKFAVCSHSQEESSIKQLLMDKSKLRVIAVDSSKLHGGAGREGYTFASISPDQIDLIVTNSPIRKLTPPREWERFRNNVGAIEDRGVPVLVTHPEGTHGHPGDQDSTDEHAT